MLNSLTLASTQVPVNQPWSTAISGIPAGHGLSVAVTGGGTASIANGVLYASFPSAGAQTVTFTDTTTGATQPISVTSFTPTPVSLSTYTTIFGFGDSITYGQNSTNYSTTKDHAWLTYVGTAVGATTTANSGSPGTILQNGILTNGVPQTNNGRDRYQSHILTKRDAGFLAYGFNDARYTGGGGQVNVANYANDYRELLNGLIIGGYGAADLHIVAPYYIIDAGLTSGTADFTGQTRAGFEAHIAAALRVATEYGTKYTPAYSYMRDNGYSTMVDTDNIHPLDAGHTLISTAVQTQTFIPNTAAKPATVSGSVSGTTITATCAAVSGAVSYDFELINNPVAQASGNSATTSYDFTSVNSAPYYLKARAVFSDGTKGPWAFSTSSYSVVSASGVFLADSFTGSSGTPIVEHLPGTGNIWLPAYGFTPTPNAALDGSGGVFSQTALNAFYRNTAVPSSADYWVQADFVWKSTIASDQPGIAGRMQAGNQAFFFVRWSGSAGGWQLFKSSTTGTSSQLGSTATDTFTSGTKTVRLTMVGTTISAQVNGTTVISVTDSSISGAGHAGIRMGNVQTASTGIHVTNLQAST